MPRLRGHHAVAGALLAGLLGWAAATLLESPCVGVADNLDYWRVMRPAGIAHAGPVERPGEFVHCRFETSGAHLGSGLSSAAVVAWAAKHLEWGLPEGPGRMDLRQVGVLYLLVAAAVLALGLVGGLPPFLAVAFLYVVVDPGYLLFFNSFYADPALFAGLLAAAVWLARIGRSREPLGGPPAREIGAGALLVLATLLGGASKVQYALLPATVLAAYLTVIPRRGSEPARESRLATVALSGALLLVAVAVPVHLFHGPAPRFPEVNRYHAVYAGLLQVSSRPDRVLEALGIPEEHRDLPRRDVWSGRVPPDHPVHDHLRELSRRRLLGDGFVALEQHLVGARLALDLLLVLLVWQGLAAGTARMQPRRTRESAVVS